jgi:hypothetical protein
VAGSLFLSSSFSLFGAIKNCMEFMGVYRQDYIGFRGFKFTLRITGIYGGYRQDCIGFRGLNLNSEIYRVYNEVYMEYRS